MSAFRHWWFLKYGKMPPINPVRPLKPLSPKTKYPMITKRVHHAFKANGQYQDTILVTEWRVCGLLVFVLEVIAP